VVCAFPAPVILRRGGRASSPSKRYCGRLWVIYTSAKHLGATTEMIDAIDDADDTKVAALDLVVSKCAELGAMKVAGLKRRARELGASGDEIDAIDDADDTKAAAVDLIFGLEESGPQP
jgi:hypothetical protein